MPHTNRARRADHYRSISAVADLSARQNRRHGDNVDRSQEGSDGGISRKGRQSDKWGNDGIAAEPIQQTRFPARSDSRGRGEDNQHALSKSTRKPSTKNQIRSLKRLMNKPGIDAQQRVRAQEQVAQLEGKRSEREKQERERELATKFRKAKFFDRRRALRHLAQIHRKLKTTADKAEREELERKRLGEETDLKYVLYFPKDKRYVPLTKGKGGSPRAKRDYERHLKEALAFGESEGWAKFEDDLEKFVIDGGKASSKTLRAGVVVGAGGHGAVTEAGVAAVGVEVNGKRKRGKEVLPVVAQDPAWEDESDINDGSSGDDVEDDNDEEGVSEGEGVSRVEEGKMSRMKNSKEKGFRLDGGERSSSGRQSNDGTFQKKPKKRSSLLPTQDEDDDEDDEEGGKKGRARGQSSLLLPEREDASDVENETDKHDERSDISDAELGGDEGFGAAASDEEDIYSLAQVRLSWGGGSSLAAGATNGRLRDDDDELTSDGDEAMGGTNGKAIRPGAIESNEDDSSSEELGEESIGDIYVGGESKAKVKASSQADSLMNSTASRDKESDKEDDDGSGEDDDSNGQGGAAAYERTTPSSLETRSGDEVAASDSEDNMPALNDAFFLEEMGSDKDDDGNEGVMNYAKSSRGSSRYTDGGSSGSHRGRGNGGGRANARGSGRWEARGRGRGRGSRQRGRGNPEGRWDSNDGSFRGRDSFARGGRGGPTGRGRNRRGRGQGGFTGPSRGGGRAGRGRGSEPGVRPNKKMRFDSDDE